MADEALKQDPSGRAVIGVLNGAGETRSVSPSNPLPAASPKGTPAQTTAAPGTTATLILAANVNRKVALLYNQGSMTVFLGHTNGVTTATGLPLAAGALMEDDATTAAWWGITASGTGDIRVEEVA